MYVPIKYPKSPIEGPLIILELNKHPLLKLPYVKWSMDGDYLGHINVVIEDKYEYEYRELCCKHDIRIIGNTRHYTRQK